MRARLRLHHSHLGVAQQGGVVVDGAVIGEHTAVPVVGELVEAGVGHQDSRVAELGLQESQSRIEHTIRIGPDAPDGILVALGRNTEEHQTTHT